MKWFISYTGWMFYFFTLIVIETIKFPYNFLRYCTSTNKSENHIEISSKNNPIVDSKRATSDWENGPYYKG